MRIGKIGSKNITYEVSGTQILSEKNGTNTTYYLYDESGSPIGLTYKGTTYYYRKNLQGDVIAIVNSSGTKVVTYTYNAWGKVISITGNMELGVNNPFRYRGYYYDTESGLYYLNSRYYDPVTGRFINADALVDNGAGLLGYNTYGYCINNPINMIDDCGYTPTYIKKQATDTLLNIYGKTKKMSEVSWGLLGNIASNGCGVIAAYNVLLSTDSNTNFGKVKNQLEAYGAALAFGKLGASPFALAQYMRSKFWFVHTAGAFTYLWGAKAELSQSVIVLIKWGDGLQMHYIAGIGTGTGGKGGSFRFYNSGLRDKKGKSIDGKSMSIWTFLDYVKSNGATPEYLIGVSCKKWWC